MLRAVRSIWTLLLGIALLALGNGLQSSLIGIQAALANFSTSLTGFIASGYSIGMLLSAFVTPKLVARVGHIRVFAAFASILSTAILLIPVWVDPVWWFAMRLLGGLCTAGLYIVIESWLNAASTNDTRGKILSVYMVLIYGGAGLGNLLLNINDTSGFVRFIVVSALMSMALVPMALTQVATPSIEAPRRFSLRELVRASPLAVVGTFSNGVGQSAFFSLGSVYGIMQGMPLAYVSLMLAFPPLTVLVSQFPIGILSDIYDRRWLIAGNSALSALVAVACVLAGASQPVLLIALFALFGALALPIYSLALAHANDHLHPDQMLGASSRLVLVYGAGAIAGPTVAGGFMQQFGAAGFMGFLAAVYALLSIYAFYRMTQRGAPSPEATGDLVQVPPAVTPVGAAAMAEQMAETSRSP